MPPSGWWLEPEMLRWLHIRPHTSSLNRGQVNKTWTVCPESWLNKWRVNKRTQRCILFCSAPPRCAFPLWRTVAPAQIHWRNQWKGKTRSFFFSWMKIEAVRTKPKRRFGVQITAVVAPAANTYVWWQLWSSGCHGDRASRCVFLSSFYFSFFFFLSCLVWFKSEISATKPQRHVLRVATRWMSVPGSNPSQILLAFLCGGGMFLSNLCGQKYNRSLVYVLFWLYLTYWLEILHNIKILMFLASFMVIYLIFFGFLTLLLCVLNRHKTKHRI